MPSTRTLAQPGRQGDGTGRRRPADEDTGRQQELAAARIAWPARTGRRDRSAWPAKASKVASLSRSGSNGRIGWPARFGEAVGSARPVQLPVIDWRRSTAFFRHGVPPTRRVPGGCEMRRLQVKTPNEPGWLGRLAEA